jgi:hypothetical protein
VSDLNDRSKPDETPGQVPTGGEVPTGGQVPTGYPQQAPYGQQTPYGAPQYGQPSGPPQQGPSWQQPGQYGQPTSQGQYASQGQYGQPGPSAQQSPYGTPPYGQPSAYDPYGPSTRNPYGPQKTNTLSILSIVFAFGGIIVWPLIILTSPAGAIMGHLALGRMKQTGEQGRGLALAGIIGGWALTALYILGVVAFVLFLAFASAHPTTPPPGGYDTSGGAGAFIA